MKWQAGAVWLAIGLALVLVHELVGWALVEGGAAGALLAPNLLEPLPSLLSLAFLALRLLVTVLLPAVVCAWAAWLILRVRTGGRR